MAMHIATLTKLGGHFTYIYVCLEGLSRNIFSFHDLSKAKYILVIQLKVTESH